LIALNPVFIYQANTLYIDSQVGLFVLLWLLSLAASFLEDDRIIIRVFPFLQILILIYSVNIKFTCSAYIFFLTVSFVLAVLILYIRKKNYFEILRKLYPIIIGGVLGVFVFGYNPYISNTINYDNPFYPVYGSTDYNSEYLIENQMPDNFHDKNSIEKLFLSIFSVTENKFKGSSSVLKFPFEVSLKEFKGMSQPDMRIGGFGPVFGLMILISFCSFIVAIFFIIKKRKLDKEAIVLIIVLFANNLSIFINPESWWARYTPQMWLNPILFILLSLLISKNEVIKFLRNLFLIFITVNIICILAVNILFVYRKRIEINTILNDYKQKDELLYVFPSIFESGLLKLERYGINYTVVEEASSLYKPVNFVGMQVSSELNK
jgi:hypothetical protein